MTSNPSPLPSVFQATEYRLENLLQDVAFGFILPPYCILLRERVDFVDLDDFIRKVCVTQHLRNLATPLLYTVCHAQVWVRTFGRCVIR